MGVGLVLLLPTSVSCPDAGHMMRVCLSGTSVFLPGVLEFLQHSHMCLPRGHHGGPKGMEVGPSWHSLATFGREISLYT